MGEGIFPFKSQPGMSFLDLRAVSSLFQSPRHHKKDFRNNLCSMSLHFFQQLLIFLKKGASDGVCIF